MTKVTYVSSVEQWNSIVQNHDIDNDILVLYCSAQWCGPCRSFAPKFEDLANYYDANVHFMKCDIDQCEDVCNKFDVSSLPTTLIIRKCKVQKRVVGADINSVKSGIDQSLNEAE